METAINKVYNEILKQEDKEYNLNLMKIPIKERVAINLFMNIFRDIPFKVMDEFIIIMPRNWTEHKQIIEYLQNEKTNKRRK